MTSTVRLAAALPTAAMAAVDGVTFREGMSCFAEAVTIVTTDGPAGLAGATATAVTSVSDNPPTILVCLNRTSKSAPRFVANGVFCVNALMPEHRELADVFAGRTGCISMSASPRANGRRWRRGRRRWSARRWRWTAAWSTSRTSRRTM